MKTRFHVVGALAICSTLACSAGEAPRESSSPEARTAGSGAASSASPEERVRRIRGLLQARHPADLPGREVLERHPDADASLRWLATNDDARIIRVRALTLLRHFPDDETGQLLLDVARRDSLPSAVRAAALRGMEGFDMSRRGELRDELALRLRDPDIMLGVAAVETLAGQPSTVGLVEQAASDSSLPRETRDAADRALSAGSN